MIKKLALAFLVCLVLNVIASAVNIFAKYYFDWFLNSSFFFAGMIYEWYLIKKLEL